MTKITLYAIILRYAKEAVATKLISYIINAIELIYGFIAGLYFIRPVFSVVGFFTTRRFRSAAKQHKYAVLVAARNEEGVIANLIDSIRSQDYPSELVDIFVVADNCTDGTADTARSHGAVCYERFDKEKRTKGFALQYLVQCIDADYGIESYEGYFIFDADNLLKKDFVSRMNESFDAGEKIVSAYRNTKNFDDNWISASYGIHWLRTVRFEHRARSLFHLATRIQGTGFLFAAELIKNGWSYTGLTEDRAFCADAVAKGYKISYNDKAEFYDEQPTDLSIAMRQRIRWAKGHLQAVAETGPKLFSHIFVTHGAANRHLKEGEASRTRRLINNLRLRFISFDMLTVVFPRGFASFLRLWLVFALRAALIATSAGYLSAELAPKLLRTVFEYLHTDVGTDSVCLALLGFVLFSLATFVISYAGGILTAAYVFFMERKRIAKIKWYKKMWFCLSFPVFDIMGKLATLIALFTKVEWKPIPHTVSTTIEEMSAKIE